MSIPEWDSVYRYDEQFAFNFDDESEEIDNSTSPVTSVFTAAVTSNLFSNISSLGSLSYTGTTPSAGYAINTGYSFPNSTILNNTVKAYNAEFENDIKVNGVSLSARLDQIEDRLAILRPNNDLEGRWEKLKALGEEYKKLEKELLEQEKIWEMLKK